MDNLTLLKHADYLVKKVQRRMNAMKVLSTLSGVSANILLMVQRACILPTIDYGIVVQSLMVKNGKLKLQRIQNASARIVLGVHKWSKSSAVLREVGQLPLANRIEAKQARVTDE